MSSLDNRPYEHLLAKIKNLERELAAALAEIAALKAADLADTYSPARL